MQVEEDGPDGAAGFWFCARHRGAGLRALLPHRGRSPPPTTAATASTRSGRSSRPSGSATAAPGSVDGAPRPRPLVRAGRRPPRRRLPPLLVHQGHGAGGRVPRRRARARSPGCASSTWAAGPAGTPTPSPAGASRSSASTSASGSSTWPPRRHRRAPPSSGPTPPALAFDARVRRRHLALPGRLRADGRARAPRSTATAPCSPAWPGRCAPAGAGRLGLLRLLPAALPRGPGHLRRRGRGEPRAHRGPRRGRRRRPRSTSGRPASRPASCASSPRRAGLEVEHLWSVTPGAYAREPPDARPPELLLVARRP